jgi:hypothetical protein
LSFYLRRRLGRDGPGRYRVRLQWRLCGLEFQPFGGIADRRWRAGRLRCGFRQTYSYLKRRLNRDCGSGFLPYVLSLRLLHCA